MGLRSLVKWLTPLGLINSHRRRFRMGRLALPATSEIAAAVDACRYDLWPSFLRAGSAPWTLVDVGANEGAFIDAVSRLVSLKEVYAFEPQPQCHDKLRRVLASIPRGHLHRAAVGAKAGEIELFCMANSSMSSVLTPDAKVACGYADGDFVIDQRIKVPLVKIDDVIPEGTEVGLLKIDVQGYEVPVLEGAKTTLGSTRALLLEVNYLAHYQGGATYDDLHEVVRSSGFRTAGISAPYSGSNGPLWADALFVRDF